MTHFIGSIPGNMPWNHRYAHLHPTPPTVPDIAARDRVECSLPGGQDDEIRLPQIIMPQRLSIQQLLQPCSPLILLRTGIAISGSSDTRQIYRTGNTFSRSTLYGDCPAMTGNDGPAD